MRKRKNPSQRQRRKAGPRRNNKMTIYEIDLKLDDGSADVVTLRRYSEIAEKYNAGRVGHEKTRTSTMTINSEELKSRKLSLEELARDLKGLEIRILDAREYDAEGKSKSMLEFFKKHMNKVK